MKINKKIILASGSPRRKQILQEAGFSFDVLVRPTDESFDPNLTPELVPEYLALKKLESFKDYDENYLVIAADTVVILDNNIFNKPANKAEAIGMLSLLSNQTHKVVTGVCIKNGDEVISFSDTTFVHFSEISQPEIAFYVNQFKPFDKAGAYGVQDFIGMVGIDKLEGSFYTVMGLPIHKVYQHLKAHIQF